MANISVIPQIDNCPFCKKQLSHNKNIYFDVGDSYQDWICNNCFYIEDNTIPRYYVNIIDGKYIQEFNIGDYYIRNIWLTKTLIFVLNKCILTNKLEVPFHNFDFELPEEDIINRIKLWYILS